MDLWMVRITILIFVVVAFGVAALLWLNPDTPSSTTQIATLLGALALACTAISPILKPEKKLNFYTLTFFRDNTLGGFMAGHGYHPYWTTMGQLFAGLPSSNSAFGPAMLVETDHIADFIQVATIKHLARDVQGAWDGQTVRLPAVYGVHPGGKYKLGTTTASETLQAADIQNALSDNHFVDLLEHDNLQVPPGTKLTSKGTGSDKYLVLEANGFKITIGTVGWSGTTLGLPLWGIIDPPVDEPTRYEIQQYTIMVMAETPRFRRYMAGIDSYWKWVANINERFEEIDWKTIDAAMIDQSRRGAYPNVLEEVIERYTRPTQQSR